MKKQKNHERIKHVVCHKDGTVTFWCKTEKQFIRHTESVSYNDLVDMLPAQRKRVMNHLLDSLLFVE